MMNYAYYGMMNGGWGAFGLLSWLLVVVFLILGIAYFWKELNKPKRK